MVKDLEGICPWINRNVINNAFKNYLKRQLKESPDMEEQKEDQPVLRPCGRPTGTTDAEKLSLKDRLMQAHNAYAI